MDDTIYIVSGLPRSGTSMMMRMLEAGGIPVLVDGQRQADEDNPRGYYELERVKQTKQDPSWLEAAKGKAVKLISELLLQLPAGEQRYRVLFMRRELEEVLRSQREMLKRRGEPVASDDQEMKRLFIAHLAEVEDWLRARPNIETLYISYNRVLESPKEGVARINRFLGQRLDEEKASAVVEAALYRQRARRE